MRRIANIAPSNAMRIATNAAFKARPSNNSNKTINIRGSTVPSIRENTPSATVQTREFNTAKLFNPSKSNIVARNNNNDNNVATTIHFAGFTSMLISNPTPYIRRSFATANNDARQISPALQLCMAASSGNLNLVKSLVDSGISVKSSDYDMRTPLHIAAAEGHLEIVEFLVKAGADVNAVDRWGGTPLQDAIRQQHDAVSKYLRRAGGVVLQNKIDIASTLCKAAAAGDIEQIKRLVEISGVDINQGDYDGRTALHLAASEGYVDIVKYLISKGAEVNVLDRFGNTPLIDAQRHKSPNHDAVVRILEESGAAVEEDIYKLRLTSGFTSSLQKSIPLLCERGNWIYGESWIPSKDGTSLRCSQAWYSDSSHVNQIASFRKASELLTYSNNTNALPVSAWKTKQPKWMQDINDTDMQDRLNQAKEAGIHSGLAIPVIYNDRVLAVLVFFSFKPRTPSQELIENFFNFSCRLIVADLQSVLKTKTKLQSNVHGVFQEQMNIVYNLIVQEGVFNSTTIYQEVDWFYNGLGLQQYYFEHFTPQQIAKHIHSFIAAKKVAQTSGNRENIHLKIEQETSAFYLCPSNHASTVEVEKSIERYLERFSRSTTDAISFTHFRSKGTAIPYGTEHLSIYLLDLNPYVNPKSKEMEHETDIWKVATGVFLRDKTKAVRERYQEIMKKAVGRVTPVLEMYEPYRDGTIPLMFAFQQEGSTHSYLSQISELVKYNNMVCERKFIETFSNGIVVYSLYLRPSKDQDFSHLLDQASLLYILPNSSLTPLFINGTLSIQQYAYAVAIWKFCFYFLSRRTEEYISLASALKNDPVNMSRLKSLQNRLKNDAVTEARISDCIHKYPELVKELFNDFENRVNPARLGNNRKRNTEVNKEILQAIKKTVTSDLDQQIFTSFLNFNTKIYKTNFYKQDKAALSFRLDPSFLADTDYPEVPFAVTLVLSNNFRGFHVRFRDVARGGIRVIKSTNLQTYTRNMENLFSENYNLAHTQQKKNKDIPEGGSKGAILLYPSSQQDAEIAFKKYVDAVLDVVLPNEDVADLYGKEEILFFGPDENTADFMDWAALYARSRGAHFWKAFTTGKSQKLGGIPHDLYGMTTRSVHRCALGALEKLGLDESSITKFQTGGPDGDLGSNEIKISKDKTIAVVDGSGVLYDPAGIDRAELLRLAENRSMVKAFDQSKLGPDGFLVLIEDRDKTLKNGQVVDSGLVFRNEFHLNPLLSADMFVPCGGRPESININNVQKMFKEDGVTPRFKIIIEGANLFLTQDARLALEKAGVIIYKDASANKGGVTSSSLEVLAALALKDDEFSELMQMKDGQIPEFYQEYVREVQAKIEDNAAQEFECIWRENERTKTPRCVLTDQLSEKINTLNDFIQESSIYKDEEIRNAVLIQALPKLLVDRLGLDTILKRVPESYMKAIFGSYLASRYIYQYGLSANEFAFYEFMQRFTNPAKFNNNNNNNKTN